MTHHLTVTFDSEKYQLVPRLPTASWVNAMVQDGWDNSTATIRTVINFAPRLAEFDNVIVHAQSTSGENTRRANRDDIGRLKPAVDKHLQNLRDIANTPRVISTDDLITSFGFLPKVSSESIKVTEAGGSVSPEHLANAKSGVKFDQDKPQMGLLDSYAIEELAKVLGFGATKYAPNNWRKGIQISRLVAAALRHLFAVLKGEDCDPETGLPHAAHAMCCCMFIVWTMKNKPECDDRFGSEK